MLWAVAHLPLSPPLSDAKTVSAQMTELANIARLWDGNHNYRLLLPTMPCVSAHMDVIHCHFLDGIDPQRSVALLFHVVTQNVPFIWNSHLWSIWSFQLASHRSVSRSKVFV